MKETKGLTESEKEYASQVKEALMKKMKNEKKAGRKEMPLDEFLVNS